MVAPPIIVAGMHRSGTTLLVRLLERCGVFMGIHQTRNAESEFFQNINRDILDRMGCSWRCCGCLPETDILRHHYRWLHQMMAKKVRSGFIGAYWGRGPKALLRLISPPVVWGWKDPRNSLLLPLWQKVFPNSKVIHIFRDGRDVALSLLNRAINREEIKEHTSLAKMKKIYVANIRLWEIYIKRIQEALPLFESHYTIRYEQLLASPEHELEQLLNYLEIPIRGSLDAAVVGVDPGRVKRYTESDFTWTHGLADDSAYLKALGYV